jgi:plastocyanin
MKMKTINRKHAWLFVLLVVVSVVFAGCTASDSGHDHAMTMPDKTTDHPAADYQPAKGEVVVEIEDFVFKPAEITVAPGTKVTWINKDEAPHTATSNDKAFNSGGLDTDDKFSFVFNEKGEFPYFCALHPHMKATITVK